MEFEHLRTRVVEKLTINNFMQCRHLVVKVEICFDDRIKVTHVGPSHTRMSYRFVFCFICKGTFFVFFLGLAMGKSGIYCGSNGEGRETPASVHNIRLHFSTTNKFIYHGNEKSLFLYSFVSLWILFLHDMPLFG